MTPSVQAIEHHIQKSRVSNTYLEPQLAQQCVADLKHHILHDQEKGRAVVVLQTVLHLSKANDALGGHFDEQLLNNIFSVVTKSTTADTVIAVLRIMLAYVSGSLFEHTPKEIYLVPFLNSSNLNVKILDVLSTKLYAENPELTVKIADFITAYMTIDHTALKSANHLVEFLLTLCKTDFYFLINTYYEDPRFDSLVRTSIKNFMGASLDAYRYLDGAKLSEDSTFQGELITEVCAELAKTSKKEEKHYIISNFSALQLMDLFFFFESPNITFKKTYHQQLLFTLQKEQIFPLTEVSAKVTDKLLLMFSKERSLYPNLSQNIFIRDLLHYHMIDKFLDIWTESQAEIDDLPNLLPLLDIILQYLDRSMNPQGEIDLVEKIQSEFKSVGYQQLRQIQLANFKRHVQTVTNEEMVPFDKILKEQVFEFVKNQRFLQLARGSWVYGDLPSFKNSSQTSSSYFFIVLSPNFTQLLFKEFKSQLETAPNIDKTGRAIPVNSIANFKIDEIPYSDDPQPLQNGDRLINLVDKTVIHKITLLNRKHKPLFSFYAKKSDSLEWVDGLNLLLNKADKLSPELNFQIGKLFEIRKTVQLLSYDENTEKPDTSVMSDDPLEFLEKLASNFYYT